MEGVYEALYAYFHCQNPDTNLINTIARSISEGFIKNNNGTFFWE